MSVLDLLRSGVAEPCRPWPRFSLSLDAWAALAADPIPGLLGLWADTQQVHALLHDGDAAAIASLAVEAGRYPALSRTRPAAAHCERMIRDLWGHVADGSDPRTWLDHGRWPLARPMSPRPGLPGGSVEAPLFPPPSAPTAMQVPLGPIHGLIEEPVHLRFDMLGSTVLRAEVRLGYAHKGILALMRGKSPRAAARFIARLAAEATVAHSLAFAHAAEAALAAEIPPRATALRAVMLGQEHIAGHLDDLARLADAAALGPLYAALGRLREELLRAAEQAFGHRLMMDAVVPGGVAADIAPGGVSALLRAADALDAALPMLLRRLDPLLGRLHGVGMISDPTVPGLVGRAVRIGGDAAARCHQRVADIAHALRSLRNWLGALPEGPVSVPLPPESGEGLACAESLRGSVWHWLRLDHGQIAAAFPCDPGWLLWPAAEAAMAGAAAEDATLIAVSCGLPSAGLDL